eukprot:9552963-Alexandrium_andersonii.AAC.1
MLGGGVCLVWLRGASPSGVWTLDVYKEKMLSRPGHAACTWTSKRAGTCCRTCPRRGAWQTSAWSSSWRPAQGPVALCSSSGGSSWASLPA